MVAARRQRQAQKLQEQQISKALAEAKPASNHVSFDDDDEDDVQATRQAPEAATAHGASDQEEEDDDAPIEVVSNKTSRRQASQDSAKLKAQEKAEKAQRQAVSEKKRLEKQKQKQEEAEAAELSLKATHAPEPIVDAAVEESDSEADEPGPSNRLDPSLFAEVFARPVAAPRSILKKRSAEEEADEVVKLQKERRLQRKKQRAGGVVKGRDGMPMKRTSDGTVLRALNTSTSHKTSFDDQDENSPEEPLDTVARPDPLDPSVSLPNAKARAFKKRTLAKKGTVKTTTKGNGAKTKKNEDDPLGLNDPAFLPGGEFYHLVNKGDKAKGGKQARQTEQPTARQAFRGGGVREDAVSALRARSRSGPSLGFARSQEGSDDDY
ncbi:hypothetical protein PSEUBRA_002712 [Kalmanozyma brasiliensis GHG001]|uniref:Uncharacterized protein n=1 Tax=Kalmanozyma brasiliensis (strain GHG001) TaxID=1365824 RepID=V5GNU1_KALBG|nr:uncharacterized protein PSEUBRA_002712 [Kalmanozyma brasiliensis GHG001]EST07622.1 hypothetical protein PSEUBRA_002712 [Kalmanozyma brasiliensis GHG001]